MVDVSSKSQIRRHAIMSGECAHCATMAFDLKETRRRTLIEIMNDIYALDSKYINPDAQQCIALIERKLQKIDSTPS